MMGFDMPVRVGGDPHGFDEFMALRKALAKLGHPACPPVDWAEIESLCLTLFRKNGVELHGAAAFTLARSQLYGLEGMTQGLALIEGLVGEWQHCWPTSAAARAEILEGLFAQLRSRLRGLQSGPQHLSALGRLEAGVESLSRQLQARGQGPFPVLQALHAQLGNLARRLQQTPITVDRALSAAFTVEPPVLGPMIIVTPSRAPQARNRWSRLALWTFLGMTVLLTGALGVRGVSGEHPFFQAMGLSRAVPIPPEPVRLNSLSLFEAGSVELRPDSTPLLVDTLVDIKAQPGGLIVITGHTDATGDAEQNQRISQARAQAVRDWMQRMGAIAEGCFAVQGLAARQPVASNDTEAGRAANRRVDIRLIPQEGACG